MRVPRRMSNGIADERNMWHAGFVVVNALPDGNQAEANGNGMYAEDAESAQSSTFGVGKGAITVISVRRPRTALESIEVQHL